MESLTKVAQLNLHSQSPVLYAWCQPDTHLVLHVAINLFDNQY